MSYIQGTAVRLEGRFEVPDPENPRARIPLDPPAVTVTVTRPSGTTTLHTLATGEVEHDGPGLYSFLLDTTPELGTWRYQFENPGGERTVKRGEITVRPRLTAPT